MAARGKGRGVSLEACDRARSNAPIEVGWCSIQAALDARGRNQQDPGAVAVAETVRAVRPFSPVP